MSVCVWVVQPFFAPTTRKDGRNKKKDLLMMMRESVNDPSAGSPTETLLRLLLPLNNKIHCSFHHFTDFPKEICKTTIRTFHLIIQSVGATGGVYKGQGRNQRKLMTCTY